MLTILVPFGPLWTTLERKCLLRYIYILFKVLKTFPYIKYTLVLCRKTEFYTFHYIMPTLVIRWV